MEGTDRMKVNQQQTATCWSMCPFARDPNFAAHFQVSRS